MPNRGKRLIGNSLATGLSSILNQILMFVTLPLLLKTVGIVEYGIYSLATAAVGYFSVISMAARSSVVKYSSEFSYDKQGEVSALFSSAFVINSGLGFLIAGIVFFSGLYCEELFKIPPEHVHTAKFLLYLHAAAAFMLQPLSVFGSLIYGMQQYGVVAVIDIIWAITRTLVILAIYIFQGSITWLALEELGFQLLKSFFLLVVARRRLPELTFNPSLVNSAQIRHILRYGGWSMLYTISLILVYQGSMVLIGMLLSVALITYYQIAYKLYNVVNSVSLFLNSAVLPASSAAIAAGDKQFIYNVVSRGTRINLIVLPILAITIWVYAGTIIRIWIGPEYTADSVMPSRILLLSWLISALSAILVPIYWGQSRIAGLSIFAVVASVLQIVASALFGSWIGLDGIAWSNFLFFSTLGLFACKMAAEALNISVLQVLKDVVAPGYGIVLVFALFLSVSSQLIQPPTDLVQLVAHVVISVLTGFAICFATVGRSEACLLWGFAKQRIKSFLP
jgi:O-antigen/teichoic acid export membrane protein